MRNLVCGKHLIPCKSTLLCGNLCFEINGWDSGFLLQVPGGTMRDSFLVNGVAFKKTFSYAGFEQQPKKFLNPKILLLNVELELKSEKENAEIRCFILKFVFSQSWPGIVGRTKWDYFLLFSTGCQILRNISQ